MEDPYRLYAIVRTDLGMGAGKIAAQCGHAFLDAFLAAQITRPDTIVPYKTAHGIKIVLGCPTLAQLEAAQRACEAAGLPCALITDFGYTHFNGQHTVTALGIGPATKAECVQITKRFSLLG